jgi:hypothetical protein
MCDEAGDAGWTVFGVKKKERSSVTNRKGADLLLLVPKLQLGNTTVQKLQLR